MGNVVGSNIFNVLLILGVSALIIPLTVSRQLIRLDVPLMIGASVLCWLLARDGMIGRVDGAVFASGILLYVGWLVRQARKEPPAQESPVPRGVTARLVDGVCIVAGLALLILGSSWLVRGAVEMAERFGVSDLVIGLTIVAAGTSLPEVVTSIVAAIRGQRDIAVGNVVGSNIFNILAVLGAVGLVAPGGVPVSREALGFDIPVMIAVAVACFPIFFTGGIIARWEGAFLLAYYAAYTVTLIHFAGRGAMPPLALTLGGFLVPLALVPVLGHLATRPRRRVG